LGINGTSLRPRNRVGNVLTGIGSTEKVLGHVCVAYYTSIYRDGPYTIGNAAKIETLDLDPIYLTDPTRLIGSGVEINNTTAELYRQGTVTVGRIPQRHSELNTLNYRVALPGVDNIEFNPVSADFCEKWPMFLADLMLISGTRQWAAEQGCYLVEAFAGQDNPPMNPDIATPVIPDDYLGWLNPPDNIYPMWAAAIEVDTDLDLRYLATVMHRAGTHSACALFTGLSEQTTMTLTWNAYIETFPDYSDPSIAVLARPSCVYDSVALHILSECLSDLPVGVAANENPFGEWFTRIVSEVANMASPFLAAIPGYGAPLAAGAAAVGQLAKEYHRSNYGTAPSAGQPRKPTLVPNANRLAVKKKPKDQKVKKISPADKLTPKRTARPQPKKRGGR